MRGESAHPPGARTTVDRPLAVVNAVNTASPALWYVSVDHLNRPVKMTDGGKASVWDAVWLPALRSVERSETVNRQRD